MKKLLALVLALVMTMSLVTISNAAFKDADKISNKEAVDVMAAVGVLAGYDNGEFGATDTLTRAQACKIIAYLDLGGKTADAIKGSGTVFSDVAATAWYAGYVEYCAGAGYVAGIGGGKFDPNANVTGVQFAKMLLCALGYKAEIEGYTGSDYTIAIARDANKNGLFDDLSIVTSASLTREQAAQMAFNALKATTVEYQGGTNVTTSDGTSVVVNAERKEVVNTSYNYAGDATDAAGKGTQQLCEKLYGKDLTLKSSSADDFGAPAQTWTYDKKDVGDYAKSAEFTFTAKVKEADMTKKLKGYTLDIKKNANYANGVAEANTEDASSINTVAKIAELTGESTLVKLYATDKKITGVVVINENLYQINKIDTKNDKVSLTKKAGTVSTVSAVEEDDACYSILSGMKQDDYVIITAANGKVMTAVAAEKVTGKVTKVTSGESVVLAGTTYKFAKNADSSVTSLAIDKDNDKVIYLDTYGNAIYSTTPSASDSKDTVYVVYTYTKQDAYGVDVNTMQAVTAAGEVITATYSVASGTTVATGDVNKAFTYTMDGDKYVLKTEGTKTTVGTAAADANDTVAKKDKKLSSTNWDNYFAADVNFVYVNGSKSDLKVTVKSGVQDATLTANDYVVIAKDGDGNYVVTTVYIKGTAVTSSDSIIYITTAQASADAKGTVYGTDGKTKLTGYEMYINGEKTTVYFKGTQSLSAGFYTYTVDDTTGAYTLSTSTPSNTKSGSVTATLFNGVYYLNGIDEVKDYDATNAKVVDVKSTVDVESMSELKDNGSTSVAVVYDTDAKTVTTIYVLD